MLKKICCEKDLFRCPSVFFSVELARKHSVETGTYLLNVLRNLIIINLTRTLPAMRILQSFFVPDVQYSIYEIRCVQSCLLSYVPVPMLYKNKPLK